MMKFLKNIFSRPTDQNTSSRKSTSLETSALSVHFDEWGIYTTFNGSEHEKVSWADINQIVIQIEDDFLPFSYWYIGNKETGVRIPNDACGGSDLFFNRLAEKIPGYSSDETYETIIKGLS